MTSMIDVLVVMTVFLLLTFSASDHTPARGTGLPTAFNGQDLLALKPHEIPHRGVGYVPEHRDVFPTLTVRQNLLLGEKRSGG